MSHKFPDFAVGVAQICSAEHAWGVQMRQVSYVCCIFWNLLQRREDAQFF